MGSSASPLCINSKLKLKKMDSWQKNWGTPIVKSAWNGNISLSYNKTEEKEKQPRAFLLFFFLFCEVQLRLCIHGAVCRLWKNWFILGLFVFRLRSRLEWGSGKWSDLCEHILRQWVNTEHTFEASTQTLVSVNVWVILNKSTKCSERFELKQKYGKFKRLIWNIPRSRSFCGTFQYDWRSRNMNEWKSSRIYKPPDIYIFLCWSLLDFCKCYIIFT